MNTADNSNTKKTKRLTPKQAEFIVDYANFVQKWNTPAIAEEVFGVTRQAVKQHQNKKGESL